MDFNFNPGAKKDPEISKMIDEALQEKSTEAYKEPEFTLPESEG